MARADGFIETLLRDLNARELNSLILLRWYKYYTHSILILILEYLIYKSQYLSLSVYSKLQ